MATSLLGLGQAEGKVRCFVVLGMGAVCLFVCLGGSFGDAEFLFPLFRSLRCMILFG